MCLLCGDKEDFIHIRREEKIDSEGQDSRAQVAGQQDSIINSYGRNGELGRDGKEARDT
jgi:hypothetical protein